MLIELFNINSNIESKSSILFPRFNFYSKMIYKSSIYYYYYSSIKNPIWELIQYPQMQIIEKKNMIIPWTFVYSYSFNNTWLYYNKTNYHHLSLSLSYTEQKKN